YALARKMPGHNLFEISRIVCGKWIGGLLNAWLIIYFFIVLVVDMRLYSDYINSAILLRTPAAFILLITVILLMYFGNESIVAVARSAALFFSIFVVLYFFTPFAFLNEIQITNFLPSLTAGSSYPLMGG